MEGLFQTSLSLLPPRPYKTQPKQGPNSSDPWWGGGGVRVGEYCQDSYTRLYHVALHIVLFSSILYYTISYYTVLCDTLLYWALLVLENPSRNPSPRRLPSRTAPPARGLPHKACSSGWRTTHIKETQPPELNDPKNGLWSIYHIGIKGGYGIWLQFYGSFGPEGRAPCTVALW